MQWEIFYQDDTKTVTVVDVPYGHDYEPPTNLGSSLGILTSEKPMIITKGDTLIKTWLTKRFAMLGIEDTIEKFNHLPML